MKSQLNSPKRTSKESLQVSSQELEVILVKFGRLDVWPWANGKGRGVHYFGDEDGMSYKYDDEVAEAKAKLLQLALSCLIDRVKHDRHCAFIKVRFLEEEDCDCGAYRVNAAIDTIEQNILKAFS